MNNTEKVLFLKLFNRGGYVLDFSTADFDTFTMESVGVASSEYINKQMCIMLENQSTNPTEAIGKAKELIESCCKTILEQERVVERLCQRVFSQRFVKNRQLYLCFNDLEIWYTRVPNLNWSHYRTLLSVVSDDARCKWEQTTFCNKISYLSSFRERVGKGD